MKHARPFALLLMIAAGLSACGPRKIKTIEIRPGVNELLKMDRKGKTQEFTAAGLDKNGLLINLVKPTWSSSDTKVFTVDVAGKVTAVGSGKAELKASYETFGASIPIEVRIVDKVELEPAGDIVVKMNKTQQLKAQVKNDLGEVLEDARVSWTMQGYAADVDQSGLVRGQALGEAVLTARSGHAEARIKVTVKN